MTDRLAMARQFMQEQIAKRDDVVGAFVCGSVARGDATETSDIDLAIYVSRDTGEGKRDLARWQEGVFIEAGAVTTEGLGSLEEVMKNPINATHLNDALILFDPTGFFAKLQEQVRSVFMEPRWLRVRLDWALDYFHTSLDRLRDAITSMDPFGICENAWVIPHAASAVPLYCAGITPSSTRKLIQLAGIGPAIRDRIVELECSLPLIAKDVMAFLDPCMRYCALMDRKDAGGLPDYMIGKVRSMIEHGALSEAVDVLWCAMGLSGPTAEGRERARTLLQEWLRGVGWEGAAALEVKLRLAESQLRDAETMSRNGLLGH